MKRYDFNSFEKFCEAEVSTEWEALTVVTENGWIKADLMTECKSWKTALRRFFKALDPDNSDVFSGWYECMKESAESGYFKLNDSRMADGSHNQCMTYAWEIEEMNDGEWYIFLNIHPGEYETETDDESGTESAAEATETTETVEETETSTESTESTEASESGETETADGTDSTSETTEAARTGANDRDGHKRQRKTEHDSGNALSALSALSANPPFLR